MLLKSNFEFLDDILLEIYKTKGKGKHISDIFQSFYGHTPISDSNTILNFGTQYPDLANKTKSIEDFFNRHDALDYEFLKVKQAVIYLENENLIYRISDKSYDLTYLGITKISNTFVGVYNKEIFEKYFVRVTIIIGLAIPSIALILERTFSKC